MKTRWFAVGMLTMAVLLSTMLTACNDANGNNNNGITASSTTTTELLGVVPGYPDTAFNFNATNELSFDAATAELRMTATPWVTRFRAGERPNGVSSDAVLSLSLFVDATGLVTSGTLVMTGSVTDSHPILGQTYSGTLLTGDAVDMGAIMFGPTTSSFDFIFRLTGGSLAPLYNNKDIGVIVNLENSTFTGSFDNNFSGKPKGNLGPAAFVGGGGDPDAPGTGTVGYWKNHPEAWPVESIDIGGSDYSKDAAIELLKKPVKGDKTISLAKQLIAAKLNVAAGNDARCIATTILAADIWFQLPGNQLMDPGVSGASDAWHDGDPLHEELDEYNNGNLCAPHRDS